MKKYLQEYCVGCGLCESMQKAKLMTDAKGFKHPVSGDVKWLDKVCPAGGQQQIRMNNNEIWGRCQATYYGWSNDPSIRKSASSGGILTEIAVYLIKNKKVDAVIQVEADKECPTKTKTVISYQESEIIARCGSRYSISSPLEIMDKLEKNKKYAFIGKPCDVTAIQNYIALDPAFGKMIYITLSFLCAGLPSLKAQENLLQALNCPDCQTVKYRGNGWPGYTIATDQDGKVHQLEYETTWGKILGRDIMKMCRFCLDGIGENADISCGDAWYLKKDGSPDFSEHDGRNMIFARTDIGKQLLDKIANEGLITLVDVNTSEFSDIQKYQYQRRTTMGAKLSAMRVLLKPIPKYSRKFLKSYGKGTDFSHKKSVFLGTGKRVLLKKI